ETLLPLLADDSDAALAMANESLQTFQPCFAAALLEGLRRKLGLFTEEEGDATLADDLLKAMAQNQADFTLTFRRLGDAAADAAADTGVRDHFLDPAAFDAWAVRWRERLAHEPQDGAARRAAMHAANPIYIPRNHRVEAVLAAAIEHDDYAPFEEMMTVLAQPFEERPEFAAYAEPPVGDQSGYKTFCGT
ncbi:MAG: protein adenylyltransferase SelO family protein, partial [Reyranella sp.]|nr:protein adenylyltransferase SelO family protein [Reyranella sp.]